MRKFRIGQLAKETGIRVETIRYYEECGLITKPSRQVSGYREFTNKHIGQIFFIRQAKAMGFTLKEILELSAFYKDKKQPKDKIHKFLENKILQTEDGISDLKKTRQSIKLLLKRCVSQKNFYDCILFKPLHS